MPRKVSTNPPTDTTAGPFALLDRWWWVLVIPGAMTLYRVLFLAFVSQLGLAEDEAQYWDWSRYLDWGYFTKPGGVAWSIAASTAAFGDTAFAVRLPAVLAGFVGSFAVGLLAHDMFRDKRIAALSSLAYLCVPAFAMLGILMTIDGPVMAAWAVAAWGGHRAMVLRDRRGWLWLAIAIAIGMQFKPTMLLVLPGVVGFAIWDRRDGRATGRAGTTETLPGSSPGSSAPFIAIGLLLVLAGFAPTIVYNATHGWVQVGHLLGHLGFHLHEPAADAVSIPNPWKPAWTLEYPVIQLAMGGAVGVLGILASLKILRTTIDSTDPSNEFRRPVRWCVSLAAPLLVFYLAVSFFTRVEGNWPIAAWVTACPLAAWAALRGWSAPDRGFKFGSWVALGLGVLVPGLLLIAPVLRDREIAGSTIPVHRLMGSRQAAVLVDQALAELGDARREDPFVMAVSYGRTAQLGFELRGNPTVYCTARYTPGGEGRQYDLWAHTDLENPGVHAALAGRPAVTMGRDEAYWQRAFELVEPFGSVALEPGKAMPVFVCAGYRGFDR